MRSLLRRLAQRIGLLRAPSDPARSAVRPLRVLLFGSIALPLTVYIVAATISYHQHFDDARDRLRRNLAIVHEHAQKVFETFEFAARYLDETIATVSDDEIRAKEGMYSERLRALTMSLPQLRDLWIIGADGQPLVSGTIYPMPKLDVSDRNYFKVHHDRLVDGPYVTQVLNARAAANTRFFAISRKREVNGRFAGVTIVSIAPEYFSEFYAQLPPPSVSALLRADGAVLVRYPETPGSADRLPVNSPFLNAIKTNPTFGIVSAPSSLDGRTRIFMYQRLEKLPSLYVTVGVQKDAIIRAWITDMASHLIFGIPAMLTLISLGIIALRRTERLEEEVSRREATELALRQAQKMEAVGRLSGGIAHDFNNMLTVILGNIDMALRRWQNNNPKIEQLLESAREASQRAATLVQRLLAFSRQHPQEVKAVDINRLVQSMSELLRRTIGETITVETVLGGGLWKTAVDANQLENAILNLAVNARDAMPNGGRLTIETSNAYLDERYISNNSDGFSAGQYVLLAVSDSGTGMSPEVRERAFDPFFTTKPSGTGTGLGLSMVYGFIKQSNGHIKIYSEVGEGTAIKLYFPRLSEPGALPEWSGERGAAPELGARGHETILLVEDDPEVRKFSAAVLREQGYTVHIAPDAASGLAVLQADPKIALLFTDVVLPGGMNGRQLADEARRQRPELKVLYATGYTRNAIIHEGRLDAEVELLNKPFTADALTRKVRQILDGSPALPPSGGAN
jgi:two-component system NtrC family sensor kinase